MLTNSYIPKMSMDAICFLITTSSPRMVTFLGLWHPKTCQHVTPLWGHLESKVYTHWPHSIEELKWITKRKNYRNSFGDTIPSHGKCVQRLWVSSRISSSGEKWHAMYSGTSIYECPNIRVFWDMSRRASDILLWDESKIWDTRNRTLHRCTRPQHAGRMLVVHRSCSTKLA
jgi:hypothetical protein